MKKTILSHFYNEEYLLPWWLKHHREIFDDGIMINYDSTDNSVEIIRELCPTWKIINSENKVFDANTLDKEMAGYEMPVIGHRIVLNITEFLIGNFNILVDQNTPQEFLIPSLYMVDSPETQYTDVKESLFRERTFGISPFDSVENFKLRRARRFGNFFRHYPGGRHFEYYNSTDFLILWYGFSPFNESSIKRKLQIQNRMSDYDKRNGLGYEHLMDRLTLIKTFEDYQKRSRCLKDIINKYV